MAATKDGAHMAHTANTTMTITEQLEQHGEVQQSILAVLSELLATNQAQSEILADILAAASEEAGPSPVAEALEVIAARVRQMEENQTRLITLVADLPEAVGRQFEISLNDWSTAAAREH
jgi:hypothetical protein